MKTLAEMIAVMQAAQQGKVIEIREINADCAWIRANPHHWNWDDFEYRVMQEPKRVPLEAKDIKPGMVFRRPGLQPDFWYAALTRNLTGIIVAEDDQLVFLTYERLEDDPWEYSTDGVNWKPCSKEA